MQQTPLRLSNRSLVRLFDRPRLIDSLAGCNKQALEHLPFEVIGFDRDRLVRLFNRQAMYALRLTRAQAIGRSMFRELAPEMNNALVAGRFATAIDHCSELDATFPFLVVRFERLVLARVRLLARPGVAMRYVLVDRQAQ